MLYIEKTHPNQSLIDWIQRHTSVAYPTYESLQTTNPSVDSYQAYIELREQLYREQRGLCCYCMQRITKDNSNIEHFLPQQAFIENQVDYYNLYLVCRRSRGLVKENQHCDIAKADYLIGKFIGYFNPQTGKKCQDFFQYTDDGYILPNKTRFKTITRFYKEYKSLTAQEKELLGTIEILNLNCASLVDAREKFIKEEPAIKSITGEISDIRKLEEMQNVYETTETKFAGVAIYFIKKQIEVLRNQNAT